LPDWADTWAYLDQVLQAMLSRLPDGGLASAAQSYVYQLTALHEDMHAEAFLYSRQTLGYPAPPGFGAGADGQADPPAQAGDVRIPGGRHQLGSDESVPFRFDNEKPPQEVRVAAFQIARSAVSNADYVAFIDAGGYQDRAIWSDAGWAWRQHAGLDAPVYWRRGATGWEQRRFDRWLPLAPQEPVIHVSWYEAEAWCRWAGRRLPTEMEWEVAASRVPSPDGQGLQSGKRRYPWGDAWPTDPAAPANLAEGQQGPLTVNALAAGDSPWGCRQMLGNVWEWTATVFGPFPGFAPDLYEDYSAPWFAEGRRVLRGGSFATSRRLIHNGYRNFFTPDRNDVPAGFRTCALD
jgi:gamma-glutamyl hercynylcysteine S-oxide synthase